MLTPILDHHPACYPNVAAGIFKALLHDRPATQAEVGLMERCNALSKELHTIRTSDQQSSATIKELDAVVHELRASAAARDTAHEQALSLQSTEQTNRHNVEVASIKQEHNAAISELKTEHSDMIKQLKKHHSDMKKQLKKDHTAEMKVLRDARTADEAQQKEKAKKAIDKLKITHKAELEYAAKCASCAPPLSKKRRQDSDESSDQDELVATLRSQIEFVKGQLRDAQTAGARVEEHEYNLAFAAVNALKPHGTNQ